MLLIVAKQHYFQFGESKQELSALPHMLRELVPVDVVKQMGSQDWKREIVRAYNQVDTYFAYVTLNIHNIYIIRTRACLRRRPRSPSSR